MFDLVLLGFLGIGAYNGYRQGFFISLISIFAFVVALILAFHLMDWGAVQLAKKVDELTFMLPMVAFTMIFLGVILIIRGLAYMVKATLDFTILGSVDSFAGAVLGIIKTAFILSFFLWIADSFEFLETRKWIGESQVYLWLKPIAPLVVSALDQYTPIIKNTIELIQDTVNAAADAVIDR